MSDNKTGFIYSREYLNHLTGVGHPESPLRLQSIVDHLQHSAIWNSLKKIKPIPVERNTVLLVHSDSYISHIEYAYDNGFNYLDYGDTTICSDSYFVALLAVGGVTEGVNKIFNGEITNAFCAVRPPGHHAELSSAMGFCLFNNAAIAARFAQSKYDIERVLIVDWDVHHGNGTQHIFEMDPNVYYISLHQYPFYPGTGGSDEIGKGDGLGATMNFPLSAGSGDEVFLDIFKNKIPDIIMKFSPEFIILSAGFDAHRRDPLGGLSISTETYQQISEIMVDLAEDECEGHLLSVLEGGYNLKALSESVEVHLKSLLTAHG